MPVLDDIISTLNYNTTVKDIRQGVFLTGVVSRHCGLASTLPRDALRQTTPFAQEPGTLLDKQLQELVHLSYSERLLEACIGLATINSLMEINEEASVPLNAAELIINKGTGKKVAIVGHFPFVPKVREFTKVLWVIEKNIGGSRARRAPARRSRSRRR